RGDPEAASFFELLSADDPSMRELHRRARDFARRCRVPWTGADDVPFELLSADEQLELTLERMARAGLLEFAFQLDAKARPAWRATELFDTISAARNEGDEEAEEWLALVLERIDEPNEQHRLVCQGRGLARRFGVRWTGLEVERPCLD